MMKDLTRDGVRRGEEPEFMELDLSSFASVKSFADSFKKKNLPLNILVNNAGIAFVKYSELFFVKISTMFKVFAHCS